MKIVIYGQSLTTNNVSLVTTTIHFFTKKKVEVFIETTFSDFLKSVSENHSWNQLPVIHKIDESFDYCICIGGDGTVLRSVTIVEGTNVPILAINTGRLGFLANIQPEELEKSLELLLNKKYTISSRTLLELECIPNRGEFEGLNYALNEVTISRKDTTSMITIQTSLNNEYLTSYWADGLIVATPTGSTGYSLSCGGPVLTPEVSGFVVNPIAPHNLNARPLVIPDDTEIKLRVSGRENQFLVSLDSRIATINSDTTLIVKKKAFKINMVMLNNETFLKTLRNKLLWGEDKRN